MTAQNSKPLSEFETCKADNPFPPAKAENPSPPAETGSPFPPGKADTPSPHGRDWTSAIISACLAVLVLVAVIAYVISRMRQHKYAPAPSE